MSKLMTITAGRVADLFAAIETFNRGEYPLDRATLLKMTFNERQLAPFNEDFQKRRQQLLEEFGKKDEAGNPILVGQNVQIADGPGFLAAFEEISKVEIPVGIHGISMKAIPENLPVRLFRALEPIIDDMDEELARLAREIE